MDTLPIENLQCIFTLACIDGGRTGLSLSLTSKAIRAASRTARFHSVSLVANPRRLQAFVALYERECDPSLEDKPRIRHLYLSFPDVPRVPLPRERARSLSPHPDRWQMRQAIADSLHSLIQSADREAPSPARHESEDVLDVAFQRGRGRSSHSPDSRTSPEYRAAARRLLHLVAPDVLSLNIEAGFSSGGELHLPGVIEEPFAVLRELTFVDVDDPAALFSSAPNASNPLFPALTHLHILVHFTRREFDIPMWSAQAPRVTHLGVTGVVTESHIKELADAVGPFTIDSEPLVIICYLTRPPRRLDAPIPPPTPPPRTYPSVQVLVMQPRPPPRMIEGSCGAAFDEWVETVEDLYQIVNQSRARGDVKAVVQPPIDDAGEHLYALDAYGDWLKRIEGRGEFWVAEGRDEWDTRWGF
ncbi:hypothetical protein C2E23DRAFT_886529 [Lenzites betulinus]|nr:hypothetical protein C2E23DRAFT_886529 [Lenzites betulinus]